MMKIIKDHKKLLLFSLTAGFLLIILAEGYSQHVDRNRNLVYGSLFWEYGFNVYDFSDEYIRENFGALDDFSLGCNLNITYEYPPLTLLFFAGMSSLPVGIGSQRILVNLVLFLIADINVLLVWQMGKRYRKKKWFLAFFVVYCALEFYFGAIVGKMETVANLFILTSIYFFKRDEIEKSCVLLAVGTQFKVYPILLLPFLLIKARKKIYWFLVGIVPTAVVWLFQNNLFASLGKHATSLSTYSTLYPNPTFLGHVLTNPVSGVTFVVFLAVLQKGLRGLKDIKNILLLLYILSFFFIAWVQYWYFLWLMPIAMVMENENDMKIYLKVLLLFALLYASGMLLNAGYYISGWENNSSIIESCVFNLSAFK
jgi:hypothetical protein